MVLDGQPEAGLAMLREVAAEPAAGATTGLNLEMASQIAAKNITAKTGAGMSALDSAEPTEQTELSERSPHGGLPHSPELATLEPSSSIDEPKAPASEPMPLLRPNPPHVASGTANETASETAPEAMPDTAPRHARSLDQELADAMAEDAMAGSHTQAMDDTESGPESKPRSQPQSHPQTAALPAPAPAMDEESATPRDWSLAAETVFATSKVAAPEEPRSASPERADAKIASAAPTVAETSPETSPETMPEMLAANGGDPRGDLAITPASTPESPTETASISDSYPIDADTFYTAQLASFRTAERARAGWQILKESAGDLLGQSDAFIVRADLGGDLGTYYRVRAGTMTDQATAKQFCLNLQAQGVDCMPVEASWQDTNETLVDKICQNGSTGVLCGTADRSDVEPLGPPYARG
jgi:SPOR domain